MNKEQIKQTWDNQIFKHKASNTKTERRKHR